MWWIFIGVGALFIFVILYDRFFQRKNLVLGNYPLLGRMRYVFHKLRPFFRQYFGDDNAFTPRIILDWILQVSQKKSGYFAFDIFDTTRTLRQGKFRMKHAGSPLNEGEMKPIFPLVGEKRKHPLQMKSYFYRSAMSLGAIGFEATSAMAAACHDAGAAFNTGEGGFAIHHVPRLPFSFEKKYLRYHQISTSWKVLFFLAPGKRLKNRVIDFLGWLFLPQGHRDLFLFDEKYFLFYTIDWKAPLSDFPKKVPAECGQIIFQMGSGLYGLRKKTEDGSFDFDWDRFQKIASFCSAFEIKLAQGAKQSGGILKKEKNTEVVSEIRGVSPGIDLISPNRFPFYTAGKEEDFFDFLQKISDKSGGKPVGAKIVISGRQNIEPLAAQMKKTPEKAPDFLTIDGGDGGSGAAPIALSILFGKKIEAALILVNEVLHEYGVRDQLKIFASAKLYAPHQSARALALGADAIGNARSIMIAGGCIRAGLCSGEHGNCPVGLATMNKGKRRAYAQAWDTKVEQIGNYIRAHNHGIIQVAAICGIDSPSKLSKEHVVCTTSSL